MALLMRALTSWLRAPPSWTHYLPKAFLLILPHWRLGLQHMDLGGAHLVHNHSPHIFPYCLAPLLCFQPPQLSWFSCLPVHFLLTLPGAYVLYVFPCLTLLWYHSALGSDVTFRRTFTHCFFQKLSFILNLCSLEHCHYLALHMPIYVLHIWVELGFPQRFDHLLILGSLWM